MSGAAEPPRATLSLKISVIARQMLTRFDQSVEQIGMTRAKWSLIAAVSRRPGATQRTIATLLHVTDVTAGRLIDRLCADGYLERRENAQDRRAYCVYLTPAAQPVLEKLGELAILREAEAFAGLSDADCDALGRILDQVGRNLAESLGRPVPWDEEGKPVEARLFGAGGAMTTPIDQLPRRPRDEP